MRKKAKELAYLHNFFRFDKAIRYHSIKICDAFVGLKPYKERS